MLSGDPGIGRLRPWASSCCISASPSPPLPPPLSRASSASAAPSSRPQRIGSRITRSPSQRPQISSSRANRPPSSPPPRPTGTAQSSWVHSATSVGTIPSGNRGIPARLLTRAAAEQATRAGQIRPVLKRPVSSSITNRAPIKGLLKPPARPAPAPTASRAAGGALAGWLCWRCRRPSTSATAAPTCTTGPSRPRGSSARLATVQRLRRARVGLRLSSSSASSGRSRLAIVWGMPEPAPEASTPRCNQSSNGTTSSGAVAISSPCMLQEPPRKRGRWASSRSCQWSTRFRGQQASPTSAPSSSSWPRPQS